MSGDMSAIPSHYQVCGYFLGLHHHNFRTEIHNGLRRRNDGSLVIGEFVDEREVQFWSCRRESNCHMARNTYRLEHVIFYEKGVSAPAKASVRTNPLQKHVVISPPLPPLPFFSSFHFFTVVPSFSLHEVRSAITAIAELLLHLSQAITHTG